MASETINKILEAEAEAERRTSEAKQRRDKLINDAQGKASLAVQKSLSEAAKEAGRMKTDIGAKLSAYRSEAEEECDKKIDDIRRKAGKNMDKAVEAIIGEYF